VVARNRGVRSRQLKDNSRQHVSGREITTGPASRGSPCEEGTGHVFGHPAGIVDLRSPIWRSGEHGAVIISWKGSRDLGVAGLSGLRAGIIGVLSLLPRYARPMAA